MIIVDGRDASSRLWNEYVARYHHYQGYTSMSGSLAGRAQDARLIALVWRSMNSR